MKLEELRVVAKWLEGKKWEAEKEERVSGGGYMLTQNEADTVRKLWKELQEEIKEVGTLCTTLGKSGNTHPAVIELPDGRLIVECITDGKPVLGYAEPGDIIEDYPDGGRGLKKSWCK